MANTIRFIIVLLSPSFDHQGILEWTNTSGFALDHQLPTCCGDPTQESNPRDLPGLLALIREWRTDGTGQRGQQESTTL
jgi:hypothetical protein